MAEENANNEVSSNKKCALRRQPTILLKNGSAHIAECPTSPTRSFLSSARNMRQQYISSVSLDSMSDAISLGGQPRGKLMAETLDHVLCDEAPPGRDKRRPSEKKGVGEGYKVVKKVDRETLRETMERKKRLDKRISASSWKYWIHTPHATMTFGLLILLNAILMGIELDAMPATNQERTVWWIVELFFVFCFIGEIVWRTVAQEHWWSAFMDPWHWFDAFIISVSVVDVTIDPMSEDQGSLAPLRVLRLLKIVRVIKLVRYLKELALLLQGILRSIKIMCWLVLCFIMLIFLFAMFITRVVTSKNRDVGVSSSTVKAFGTMPMSMLHLFRAATLDNWTMLALSVNEEFPGMIFFFVGFILLTNIFLLNILTGVIIENVLEVSRNDEGERAKREAYLERQSLDNFLLAFCGADANNDGFVSREEFVEFLSKPSTVNKTTLNISDAHSLFDIFDIYDQNGIDIDDFVEGLTRSKGPAQGKHVLEVQYNVRALGEVLSAVYDAQIDLHKRVLHLEKKVDDGLARVLEELCLVHGKLDKSTSIRV